MPISDTLDYPPGHWAEVKKVIDEAIEPKGYRARLVSEGDDVGVIHARIVQSLFRHDIVICDISSRNPNVMVELGLRLAFDKPTIIIRDEDVGRIFDIDPIEYVPYPKSLRHAAVQTFQETLGNKLDHMYKSYKQGKFKTVFLGHFQITEPAKLNTVEAPAFDVLSKKMDDLIATVSRGGLFPPVVPRYPRALFFFGVEHEHANEIVAYMANYIVKPIGRLKTSVPNAVCLEYDMTQLSKADEIGILNFARASHPEVAWNALGPGPTGIS